MNGESITGDYVLQVISDYMKYAMQIDVPKQNTEYKKMEQELHNVDRVCELPII